MDRLRFLATVLLPVTLVLLLSGAAIALIVYWSSGNVDARALERQSHTIALLLESERASLLQEQGSSAIWDDALVYADRIANPTWLHVNIGSRLNRLFGHDRIFVFNGLDQVVYAMVDGRSGGPQDYDTGIRASVAPLIQQLRLPLAAGGVGRWQAGMRTSLPGISEFALIDGQPAIIAATPIVSSTGFLNSTPGAEPLLVSIVSLDQAMANDLTRDYLFEDARFVVTPSTDIERAAHPVSNADGRFIAFLEWSRDNPGRIMLEHTGPVLAAGFVVSTVLMLLLMSQLRRSSAAVEAGRRSAEYQAAHDRLTGLPNRMSFDRRLAKALDTKGADERRIDLMLLDLDRFKQVNDTLGHQAGDELICRVTERIVEVVGTDVVVARIGGDEFAILVTGCMGQADTMSLANRIIDALGKPFTIRQVQAFVGASIGMVSAWTDDADALELMRRADIALYEAKASGRNRAVPFAPHMDEQLQVQRTLEAELREALQRKDQLSVAFQPLVDRETRSIIGAEALARWQHPLFGSISPTRFIPVAESSGLIEALGEFVLRDACALGALHPGHTIAVNISPTQLRNPDFAVLVFNILRDTDMRADDLELEITESILLDDEHVSAHNLRTLRSAGIHVALDDFGTGYSSLSYLKRYPVDRIKIDRSFVTQLASGHVSVDITRALVHLAHAMNMHVTAEGVETEEQAAILSDLGCNTLQGYLFSAAVERQEIEIKFLACRPLAERTSAVA